MQYLLSEEEYQKLKTAQSLDLGLKKEKLQKLCTQIATTMPIRFWGRTQSMPWGCILAENSGMEYCDDCPVQEICPNEHKEWSK